MVLHNTSRALLQSSGHLTGTDQYFVTVAPDGNFALNCQKVFIAGWNQWEVVEAAAGAPITHGATLPTGVTGPQLIRTLWDTAVENNLNLVRFFAFGVSPEYALQPSPGQYSEAIFRGLDYALEQLRTRGLKAILAITDNWQAVGGADQYVKWCGGSGHSDFFSNGNCMQLYKNFANTLISRVNTVNGRVYASGPLRFPSVQSWIATMAAYVKGLDPNHLLSVGSEGFYSPADTAQAGADPQGAKSWALSQGQDFIANNQVPQIDFATVHRHVHLGIWVDNWFDDDINFQRNWVRQHASDGGFLGKPVLLEEFGKWIKGGTSANLAERDEFYQAVYQEVQNSAQAGGPLKGAAFWNFLADEQQAPAAEGGGSGLYGIKVEDSTFSFVHNNANLMSSYEGPDCDVDIDECVRAKAGCSPHAGCINSQGGFTCTCYYGFSGNGTTCDPTPALDALAGAYVTDGPSKIACTEGSNIAQPPGSPGWVDDPTGSVQGSAAHAGGAGSVLPVSVQDCEVACEMAQPECTSFSYNPTLTACFLKQGGTRATCSSPNTPCYEANQNLQVQTFSCGSWQTYFRQASTPSGPSSPAVAEASGPSSPTPSPVPTPSPTPSPSPGLDGGPLGANPFTSFLGG
ncbi:g10275 [Coccomyxa viridis]|uniref:mannan endo-1,4-beta-mannosidase n=1 Tax=Coccomyxa viridis TaxID=1274662 RepID=A0ABP1GB18_9CHLO